MEQRVNGTHVRFAALLLALMGLYFLLLARGVEGLKVPPSLLVALAVAMFAAAIAVVTRHRHRGINAAAAAIVLWCLAGTGFWIAFSPEATGGCRVTLSDGTPGHKSPEVAASDSTCRVVFGGGAFFSTVLGAVALFHAAAITMRRTAEK